uniref:protein-disulfide reductase n=1 Tax=Salix viminalis TaxID=40686 RepID=A0A6N2LD06_SALVM
MKEMNLEENSSRKLQDSQAEANGDSHRISGSRFSSLLASKDRDYLLSQDGSTQVKVSDLEGKVLGLYFSANWYAPCRSFTTQVLIGAYQDLKSNGSNFEIVFVSSDEDVDAFNNYRANMPWLSIPFSDLETKKALNNKFDVEAIPCLVILQPKDSKDEATLRDGVELLDRFGVQAFPFTKERLEELKLEEKEKHERQTLNNLLTNHNRGYLLGHPEPTQFTPKLISIYQKIKQMLAHQGNDDDFEIVFVSSDRDQAEFDSYFNSMPWLALPFGDPAIKTLAKYFDVKGIPCLVILGPDGKTVSKHGRNLITSVPRKCVPFY